jgi:hypothetical protein
VKRNDGQLLILGCLLYILVFVTVDYFWGDADMRDPFAAMGDVYYTDGNLRD